MNRKLLQLCSFSLLLGLSSNGVYVANNLISNLPIPCYLVLFPLYLSHFIHLYFHSRVVGSPSFPSVSWSVQKNCVAMLLTGFSTRVLTSASLSTILIHWKLSRYPPELNMSDSGMPCETRNLTHADTFKAVFPPFKLQ